MTARPAQRHRTKIAAPLLIAGLTLSAGATCGLPLGGCGGPPAGVAPATLDPLPDHIVQRLTDCGKRGPTPLAPVQHTVAFDVFMNPDGEVQEVALRDTTLHFDEVEACMQSALGGLSGRVADGPLRRREPTSPAPPEPETRTLLASPVVIAVGVAEVAIVVGVMVLTVVVYYQVVRNTQTLRPPPPLAAEADEPAKPEPAQPEPPKADPSENPKTTGPTPPAPPKPPEPPKPKPRCEDVFPRIVNCFYIKQEKYPSLKAALEAAIQKLPKDRQKRPFTTNGAERADERLGAHHITYYSADSRTKITIGYYKQCCKNTAEGPVLVEGKQCYEHNTQYLR